MKIFTMNPIPGYLASRGTAMSKFGCGLAKATRVQRERFTEGVIARATAHAGVLDVDVPNHPSALSGWRT
ncbi:hypothetical protein [Actinokineospora sp.]|uniref:hypothetical protein n=1 Tax=Actinokineospora sp. TaxID=1872133 RepID=UPI0040382110